MTLQPLDKTSSTAPETPVPTRIDFAPNSIWTFKLPNYEALNRELTNLIHTEYERDPESRECAGRNLWQGKRQVTDEPSVQKMFAPIFGVAKQIAAFLQWDVSERAPKVQVCWANIHGQGAYHTRHIHPATEHLSGVYYVEAPPECGDIVFHDLARFLGLWGAVPPTLETTAHNRSKYAISPQPGLCVLFPAYLMHEVELNSCGKNRLGLAFNINFEKTK